MKQSFPFFTGREAIQFTWNGDIYARNVNGVKVVINHDDLLLNGFSVHTAYPCHVEWEIKMVEIPAYFATATDGFYQFAVEDDDRSIEFMVDLGVRMVRQSQCADLLAYIDDLLGVTDDTVLQNTWWASGAAYGFDDPGDTRDILRQMRDRVAERVATGGGGMPG